MLSHVLLSVSNLRSVLLLPKRHLISIPLNEVTNQCSEAGNEEVGNPLKYISRDFQFLIKQKPFDVASSLAKLFHICTFSDGDAMILP